MLQTDVFISYYRVRDGTLQCSTFRQYVGVARSMVREQLEAGAVCRRTKTAGMCRELLTVEPTLWTFVSLEGVEPTNNAAERALRHAVLWRKNSRGNDSETVGHLVGNILTVVATCRQQGRDVLEYLTSCCRRGREYRRHENTNDTRRASGGRGEAATKSRAPLPDP
jgi:transposase